MATIRRKVYNQNGILVDIDTVSVINVKTGKDNAQLLNTVKYNSEVDSSNLFELTKNLIENDINIDHEKNAINNLIDEGVLQIYGKLFDFKNVYNSITSKNNVTIGQGNIKINVNSINNIFTIQEDSVLEINNINIQSVDWYRRDLIVLVFYDTNTSKTVPYIKHISGVETDIPEIPYNLNDRVFTSTIGYYPLYQVLYQNKLGITTYINHSQIYNLAGFKSVITLNGELLEQYIDDDDNIIDGLYRIRYGKYIHLTKKDGSLLSVEYGQSNESYEIDGGSQTIEKNNIIVQEPDIGIHTTIADGGILNFPFQFKLDPNQYFPRDKVTLSSIEIAIQNFENIADWPEEGIELYISTAKYYVNENNNGIFNLTSNPTINNGKLILNLSLKLSDMTQLTYDNRTFESISTEVRSGINGDFIFIISGKGQYQISRILNKLSDTSIAINELPFEIDTTSKFIIFNTQSIVLAGDDISNKPDETESDFYNEMTDEEKQKYKFVYHNSINTAISKLHWDNQPEFAFENIKITPFVYDASHTAFELPYPIKIDEFGEYSFIYIYSLDDEDDETRIDYKEYVNKTLSTDSTIILNISLPIDIEKNHLYDITVSFISKKQSLKYFFEQDPDDNSRLYTVPNSLVPIVASSSILATGHDFSDENREGFYIAIKQNNSVLIEKDILLDNTLLNVSEIVAEINQQLMSAPDISSYIECLNINDLTITLHGKLGTEGSQFSIVISATTNPLYGNALATLGFVSGTYYGVDSYVGYVKAKLPFILDVNYRQWYFVQPSIYDDAKPLVNYGKRPEIVTTNPTLDLDKFSTYLNVICKTTEGLYPSLFENEQIVTISDLYGDINNYSNTRGNVYGTIKKVAKYVIQSRCLTDEFAEYRIPPHRDDDDDIAICYFDIINGLISFNSGTSDILDDVDSEIPENLKIICSFNNVFTGEINWSDIQGRPDDYGSIKELVLEAQTDGQKVFELGYYPASKVSINVDINGKLIPSDDFELIDGGNKLMLINYACSIGETVHIKGSTSTKNISISEGAVTSNSISDGAIISSKLADKSVTTSKLADEIGISIFQPKTIKLYDRNFIDFINYEDGSENAEKAFAILKYGPPTQEITKILTSAAKINTYTDINRRYFYVYDTVGKRFNIYFGVLHGSESPDDIVSENPALGCPYSIAINFENYERGTDALTTTFHNTWFEIEVKTDGATKKYTIVFRAVGLDGTEHFGSYSSGATEINVLYNLPTGGNIYNGSKDDLIAKLVARLNQLGVCPEVIASPFTSNVKIDYIYNGEVSAPFITGNAQNITAEILLEGHSGYVVDTDNINIPIIVGEYDTSITVAQTLANTLNNNSSFQISFSASVTPETNEVLIICNDFGSTLNVVNINTKMNIYTLVQGLFGESPTNEDFIAYGKFQIDQIWASTHLTTDRVSLNSLKAIDTTIIINNINGKIGFFGSIEDFNDLTFTGFLSDYGLKTKIIFVDKIRASNIEVDSLYARTNAIIEQDGSYYDIILGTIDFKNTYNGTTRQLASLELSNDEGLKSESALNIVDTGYVINMGDAGDQTFYSKFVAHKIYNAVWNDIAEFMPSDGSCSIGDLVVVDVGYDKFRVTQFDKTKHHLNSVLGIVSESPGFVVGWNPKYDYPVEIALKGMVTINRKYFPLMPVVGDRIFLFTDGFIYAESYLKVEYSNLSIFDIHEIGTVIEVFDGKIKIFLR